LDLTPALVLATWTAGLAGAGAVAISWRVVGPGYTWLTAGVVAMFGASAAAAGGGGWAWAGVALAVVAAVVARRPVVAAGLLGLSALLFLAAVWIDEPLGQAVTGALLLGGITSEMLLGHWFLVDPRLPRWALYRLAYAAAVGLVADVGLVAFRVAADGLTADAVFGWAYVALVVMTGLLIAAVWFSLREPRYSGVMAATGLSYLAVLTSAGVMVVGRIIAFS
jgi:hypothetical protein